MLWLLIFFIILTLLVDRLVQLIYQKYFVSRKKKLLDRVKQVFVPKNYYKKQQKKYFSQIKKSFKLLDLIKEKFKTGEIKFVNFIFLTLINWIWIGIYYIGIGIYKFFAFLGQPGHYFIRYAPYAIVLNVYKRLFGAERYLLIFMLISWAISYGVSNFYSEDDPNFQRKMAKIDLRFVIILFASFGILIILRGAYNLFGVGLPDWDSSFLTSIFDFFHELIKDVISVL